jgi:hypothetical protein
MRNSCLVALFLPSLLLAQGNASAPSDQKCVLSGRATAGGTGQPLNKATVQLQGNSQTHTYTAVSNPDGSFQFLNIEPGSYRLWAEHDGFLSTSYGARGGRPGGGTVLNLKPGQQLTSLDIALTPQGVIAGKIIDDDGEPATSDGIQVLAQTWVDGKQTYQMRSSDQPDDRGEFRVAKLAPGKYILCAQIRPDQADEIQSGGGPVVGPVTTYYPSAISIEEATPIDVRSGQEIDAIEIRMRSMRTFHVRGKLAGTLPQGMDREQLQVVIEPQITSYMFFNGESNISKTGAFDISGVGPGTYEVRIFAFLEENGPTTIAMAPVTVGSADVNGLTLNVIPPGTLHGKVTVEGTGPQGGEQWNASNVRVWLGATNTGGAFGPQSQASAESDGTFTVEDIAAGSYKLHVSGNPNTMYLKSVLLNAQDVTGRTLDLSQGGSGELELVFRYGAAELSGTVQSPESNATAQNGSTASTAASANVVLIPDDENSSASGMKFAESDQNSSFHIKGIAPGAYHIYAFEQAPRELLQVPALIKALSDKGTEVEVKEKDSKQVQLPVVSAEDMRQLLTRLGLEAE